MNRYTFNQTQLYALLLFAGLIPVLTLVVGFHLAWQYHESNGRISGFPVVLSEQLVNDNAAHLESLDQKALQEVVDVSPQEDAGAIAVSASQPLISVPEPDTLKQTKPGIAQSERMAASELGFALQLGAFKDKQRAIAWASQQKLKHQNVHLLKREIAGKIFYTVAVGH